MGMSASQVRLLNLTARMHDIEYKAQNILAQKLALSVDKDEIYETYCNALDKTKIQVAFTSETGTFKYVDANFQSVCTYQEGRARTEYALQDSRTGEVYLTQEQADLYEMDVRSPYIQKMLQPYQEKQTLESDIETLEALISGDIATFTGENKNIEDLNKQLQEEQEKEEPDEELIAKLKEQIEAANVSAQSEERNRAQHEAELANKNATLSEVVTELQGYIDDYNTVFSDSVTMNDLPDLMSDYDKYLDVMDEQDDSQKTYYERLFELVRENNYKVIPQQYVSGDQGNEWFNNMIQSGVVTLQEYISTGANPGWSDTDVTTSSSSNFLQEVEDETAIEKAKAVYEHELDIINDKDAKFDNETKKLETEEEALQNEIDSLKTVIDDNAERTMNLFG